MSREYILSAVGGNRPGVVAEIARQLYLSGIRIENSSMTLLAQHFTLMLHIVAEEDSAQGWLRDKLRQLQENTEISTHIFAVPKTESGAEEVAEPRYTLRVRGGDRSGIVYKTSLFLARKGVNILRMDTRMGQGRHSGTLLFRMDSLIEIPDGVDESRFRNELESLAGELQESVTLTRADASV